MKVFVLFLYLFFFSNEVGASEYPFQKAFLYLGKVPRERGIRVVASQERVVARKGGKWCQKTGGKHPRTIPLDVTDAFFRGNPPRVEVEVDYFDEGVDTFVTIANTLEGDYRVGRILKKENSKTWRTYAATLHFPQFGERENVIAHPDLSINNRWDGDEFIRMVRVRIPYLHQETGTLGNLFEPGEPVKLRLRLFKRGRREEWKLSWSIKDWKNHLLHSGESPFPAVPGFSVAKEIVLPPLPQGAYQAAFVLKKGNRFLEETTIRFGVSPRITLKGDSSASPFGVCTELATPLARDKVKLLKGSGIVWVRQVVRGDRIYSGGRADWKRMDDAVNAAGQEKLHLLGTLLGGPPGTEHLATNQSRRRFTDYAAEVAERYPTIRHWEIWNEPDNLGFWETRDVKRYAALVKTVSLRLKQLDPSYQIMNGGLVAGNYWYLGKLYEEGLRGFLDTVAIHPYAADPESGKRNLGMRIEMARAILAREDPGRKIWLTEVGWDTSKPGGLTFEDQAAVLVRAMTVALSSSAEKIFWFSLDDLGEDEASNVQNAGLLFKDLSPKPSFIAYRNLIGRLSGKLFVKKDDFGEEISAYRFEDAHEIVWVVWSRGKEAHLPMVQEAGIEVLDIMGNPRKTPAGEGRDILLPASGEPLFILKRRS